MKLFPILMLLLTLPALAADYEFFPAQDGLAISFEGKTQEGNETHRFELRQLTHVLSSSGIRAPTTGYYVIYYAGGEYGPEIIGRIDGHSPVMKKKGDKIEIYYMPGANTHAKQTWELQGGTATLLEDRAISWKYRPQP